MATDSSAALRGAAFRGPVQSIARRALSLITALALVSSGALASANVPSWFASLHIASPSELATLYVRDVVGASIADATAVAASRPAHGALDEAASLLRSQRNEEALHLLRRVHAHRSFNDEVRAAHLLAYALFVNQRYAEAADQLSTVLNSTPREHPRWPWLTQWYAESLLESGEVEAAAEVAGQLLSGDFDHLTLALAAEVVRARALARQSQRPQGSPLYTVIEKLPEHPQRRTLLLEAVNVALRTGETDEALRHARTLMREAPWSQQATELAARALQRPELREGLALSLEETFQEARAMRLRRQWDVAEELFADLLARYEPAAELSFDRRDIGFQLALNAYAAGDYPLAKTRYEALIRERRSTRQQDEIEVGYAWTLSRIGQRAEALAILDGVAARASGSSAAALRYEYAHDFGQPDRALTQLDDLSRRDSPDAFERIFLRYLNGEHALALERLVDRAAQTTLHDRAQALYWAGRSALHLGQVPRARELFEEASAERYEDYYAILARSRLAELDASGPHEDTEGADATPESAPAGIRWHGLFDAAPSDYSVVTRSGGELSAYHPALGASPPLHLLVERNHERFPTLLSAAALHEIGAENEAREAFRYAARELLEYAERDLRPAGETPLSLRARRYSHLIDNRRSPRGYWGILLEEPLYPLPASREERVALATRQRDIAEHRATIVRDFIHVARSLNDHYIARRLALRQVGLRGTPRSPVNLEDWYLAWPRPYAGTVQAYCERYNLNPYLLWALIIVESDMNPDSISVADAYGLMQVIPMTGERVAAEIGDDEFGIHALIDPHVAIDYGAWYLAQLVTKFDGQESFALVGYNAGPHRVARWLDWRGEGMDYDEFLETVPFSGARNYHKRIIRYMATYQALYEGSVELYIGNDLQLDYSPTINF